MVAKMAGATFTVLQTEQCLECAPNHSNAEAKMAAAAAQIRAANRDATVLLYFPVDQARPWTALGAWFDAHPELLLRNLSGGVFHPGTSPMAVPDYGQPAAVAQWANGVAEAVKAGDFDGVFIDGYRTAWADGYSYKVPIVGRLDNVTEAKAWVSGIWNRTGPALRAALPNGAIMIPNCEAQELCEDGHGHSQIPGYNSVMMEYFGTSAGYIDNVANVAAADTFAEINAYVKMYAGNLFVLPNLVAFLAGAGNRTVFGAIGPYWNCYETAPLLPEFTRQIGPPQEPAVTKLVGNASHGYQTWRRRFGNGTSILMNISYPYDTVYHSTSCCIWWSSGEVSTCPNSICPPEASHIIY